MEVIRHGAAGSAPSATPGSAPAATPAPAGDPFGALTGSDPEAFRARQLRARDLLRGELEGDDLEQHVRESIVTTTLDQAVKWAQGNSIFPLTFGLACCSIEMISLVGARMDISRFGSEAMRGTPRQADLIILAGRVSMKMAPVVRRVYDQMLEPKYAIAMGACSSSMGVFNNYSVVPADKFMPVDVHVPGCPPRPEAVVYGILKLRKMIQDDPTMAWRDRYQAHGTEEWAQGTTAGEQPDIVALSRDLAASTAARNAGVTPAGDPASGPATSAPGDSATADAAPGPEGREQDGPRA